MRWGVGPATTMADSLGELKNGFRGCTFVGIVVSAVVLGIGSLSDNRLLGAPRFVSWILVFSPVGIFLIWWIVSSYYRR